MKGIMQTIHSSDFEVIDTFLTLAAVSGCEKILESGTTI